jgi:hypothetical protein
VPVRKFRTFQEAEEGLWNFHPDEKYYIGVRKLFRFAAKLHPPVRRSSYVLKFRTIQDASANP